MYLFECEVTFEAEPAVVWRIWTDVARWPDWDASKGIAQIDGEFQAGSSGLCGGHPGCAAGTGPGRAGPSGSAAGRARRASQAGPAAGARPHAPCRLIAS
ncbi:MAG: hypothetical protein ACLPKI_29610 [Streptosporangiaceae bacterium]